MQLINGVNPNEAIKLTKRTKVDNTYVYIFMTVRSAWTARVTRLDSGEFTCNILIRVGTDSTTADIRIKTHSYKSLGHFLNSIKKVINNHEQLEKNPAQVMRRQV